MNIQSILNEDHVVSEGQEHCYIDRYDHYLFLYQIYKAAVLTASISLLV